MDKRSFFAIILSSLTLIVWMQLQTRNNLPTEQALEDSTTDIEENVVPDSATLALLNGEDQEAIPEEIIEVNTDIYSIKLSSKNGVIVSGKLHQLDDYEDESIELIPKGDKSQAFRILWGDEETLENSPDVYYHVERTGSHTVEFYRNLVDKKGSIFEVRKVYTFKNTEHLIELKIIITNSKNDVLKLGDQRAYSLMFGPQLGPLGEVLDTQKSKQLARRRLVGHNGKKVKTVNVKLNRSRIQDTLYKWVGISGRYISMLVLTGSTSYTTKFATLEEEGLNSGAQLYLQRPPIQSSAVEDKYRIYLGPNVKPLLQRYNANENNAFGINNADFDDITPARLLRFIEKPMYVLLKYLQSLTGNYGFAIILLTVFVRLLTLPIINKSKKHGERMKAIGPKMQDIRTKYANDPMRMNQEIMQLYKKEKVSPFSSMGPMFIQIPIFLTMYRVIYESFELWQAPFISWITDLSVPDQLISFGDFVVPLLGWNSLNLLPVIMLASQFISSFIMMKQQDMSMGGTSASMMFIMSYVFPFMIFFALYNSPSGLILYWICSNIFTIFSSIKWKQSSDKTSTAPPINTKKNLIKAIKRR